MATAPNLLGQDFKAEPPPSDAAAYQSVRCAWAGSNDKGLARLGQPLDFILVAGTGFEPVTFGL